MRIAIWHSAFRMAEAHSVPIDSLQPGALWYLSNVESCLHFSGIWTKDLTHLFMLTVQSASKRQATDYYITYLDDRIRTVFGIFTC